MGREWLFARCLQRESKLVMRRKVWQFIGKRKGERWKEEELSRRCYSKVLISWVPSYWSMCRTNSKCVRKSRVYLSSKIIQLWYSSRNVLSKLWGWYEWNNIKKCHIGLHTFIISCVSLTLWEAIWNGRVIAELKYIEWLKKMATIYSINTGFDFMKILIIITLMVLFQSEISLGSLFSKLKQSVDILSFMLT